ncbi:hypothetical protein DID80_07410, partial [Candidatus Marinamargulisbacteria bacterium SCGC AAA071-K20]
MSVIIIFMSLKKISKWLTGQKKELSATEHLAYLFKVSKYPYIHTKTLIPCTDPGVINSNRHLVVEKVGQALLTHVVYQLHLPHHITAKKNNREFNFKPALISVVKDILNFKLPESEELLISADNFLITLFRVGIVDLLICLRKPDLAELAIQRGCSLTHTILERFTMLHLATLYGYKKLIEIILKNTKLKATSVDALGNTPLHYASMVHHQGMERLIIKAAEKQGIPSEKYEAIQNKLCGTARDYAYKKTHEDYFEPYIWVKENETIEKCQYDEYLKRFNVGILRYSIPNPQVLIDLILFMPVHLVTKTPVLDIEIPGVDQVYIAKTKDKGWGLFARDIIREGTCIGYAGEICNLLDLEGKNFARGLVNPYCIDFN